MARKAEPWSARKPDAAHAVSPASLVLRALPSLVSVIGGEFLLRLANFFIVLLIARAYGAEALGLFATALAYCTVATSAGDLGLQAGAIEQISRNPSRLSPIVSTLYAAKTLLMAPLTLVVALVTLGLGISAEARAMTGLVGLRILIQSYGQLHMAAMKSINRGSAIGFIQFIHFVALAAGMWLVHHFRWNLGTLLWWMIGCQVFELLLSGGWLWNAGLRPREIRLQECWRMLRTSTPIGLTYLAAALIVRLDVIVLALFVSSPEVGHFAAANALLVLIYVVAWHLGMVMLPDLVRLQGDLVFLAQYIRHWKRILWWTAAPLSLAIAMLAPRLIGAAYGERFVVSGSLGAVMFLAMPFIFLNVLHLNMAVASHHARLYLGTYVVTAVFALILNTVLGTVFGSVGIATAIPVREVAMFLLFQFRSQVLP